MKPSRILQLLELESRLAPADLRIVTYNITAADGTVRAGIVGTPASPGILDTIGVQTVNGVSRPADVILLQEIDHDLDAAAKVVSLLNTYYGSGKYAYGTTPGDTLGGGTQAIVYRTETVDLNETLGIGTASGSGAPRQPVRFKIRLDGTTTDIYIYNSHMKANGEGTEVTDIARRLIEAELIRDNADTLPASANILYIGDLNLYDSDEPAYDAFLAAGNGKAMDVVNPAGNWVNNSNAFVSLYTQAPLNNAPSGLVGGGLDDRFDFILMSTELSDSTGLEYKTNSYRVFGNNGSLSINTDINKSSNTALGNTGLNAANQQAVLNYLTTASDHLPVVADFTFPTPPPPGPTAVTSYAVNGGAQRSLVKSVTIAFNAVVPSQLTAANFTLTGFGGTLGVAHTAGTSSTVLTFSGIDTHFGSLDDGNYSLAVSVSGVTTNTNFAFHRLFGDINADETVDAGDFALFGGVFGYTIANSPFDFDASGLIDAGDFGHFGVRFGKSI